MVTLAKKTKVVDCDTHFWQPLDRWVAYVEPKHRDTVAQFLGGLREKTSDISKKMGMSEYYAIRGGDDPAERLKWMDSEGMDANVIYPGAGLVTTLPEAEAASAACRALNLWAAEFARAAPDRLKPCIALPMRHPEHAVRELAFACQKLGLKTAFVAPTPAPDRRWSESAYDPLWGEMQDSGVVLTFHEFSRVPQGDPVVARPSYKDLYPFMYFCAHIVEIELAMMDVIGGGVLERFPRLQVGFVEANVAWLPGWLTSMDSLWGWLSSSKRKPKGTRAMSLTATEFFRRQCFIDAFPDDAMVPEVVNHVGEDNVVLCTDYPHPGTTYRMAETFRSNYPELPERVKRKLLGGNAERIFGL